MKKSFKRYMAIDETGKVLAQGNRLMDVEGPGDRFLIDYKKMVCIAQGFYPLTRYAWRPLKGFSLTS